MLNDGRARDAQQVRRLFWGHFRIVGKQADLLPPLDEHCEIPDHSEQTVWHDDRRLSAESGFEYEFDLADASAASLCKEAQYPLCRRPLFGSDNVRLQCSSGHSCVLSSEISENNGF